MRFKLLGTAILTAGLTVAAAAPAFAGTGPCHPPVVAKVAHRPCLLGTTDDGGTFYTGGYVFPGEHLTFSGETYTVTALAPVFAGIFTGQQKITFSTTAGLPDTHQVEDFQVTDYKC